MLKKALASFFAAGYRNVGIAFNDGMISCFLEVLYQILDLLNTNGDSAL